MAGGSNEPVTARIAVIGLADAYETAINGTEEAVD